MQEEALFFRAALPILFTFFQDQSKAIGESFTESNSSIQEPNSDIKMRKNIRMLLRLQYETNAFSVNYKDLTTHDRIHPPNGG